MIVVDASVALQWLFDDGAGRGAADALREGHVAGAETIAVPDLFYYEAANVLALTARLPAADSAQAFSLLWELRLERFDFGLEEFTDAMRLARRHKTTLYDAAYVELARRLGTRFVTADRKLYEKTRSLGLVELL